LVIHYSSCVDEPQLKAIENLLTFDDRKWDSFTVVGINEFGDFDSPQASFEEIQFLFQALKNVKTLNLHSSTLHRGHGLEMILSSLASFTGLKVLCLEGWQIDRISASMLITILQEENRKTVKTLSMRSCRFLAEDSFHAIVRGLKAIEHLRTLEVSCCDLGDNDIISLIESIRIHPGIENVNLERNKCRAQASVSTIAKWIVESQSKLLALNVRGLWTGFSEEGLEQRFVDLVPFLTAVTQNSSLQKLVVSENYLDNDEIQHLARSLLLRHESTNLCTLDVGANPFDENGAEALLTLARNLQTLQEINLQNSFLQYKCAELIKIQSETNFFNSFLGTNLDIPLSLWPHAFARIQKGTQKRIPAQVSDRSGDHIYRLLRATTGSHGKQLSHRIAIFERLS